MIYPLDFRVPSVGTTPDGSYSNRATPAKTRAIAPPPFKPRRARHVVAPKSRIPAHSCAPLLQGWHRSTRTKPTAAHRAPRVEHLQNMRRTCAIQRSLEDSKLKKKTPPPYHHPTTIQPPSNHRTIIQPTRSTSSSSFSGQTIKSLSRTCSTSASACNSNAVAWNAVGKVTAPPGVFFGGKTNGKTHRNARHF